MGQQKRKRSISKVMGKKGRKVAMAHLIKMNGRFKKAAAAPRYKTGARPDLGDLSWPVAKE